MKNKYLSCTRKSKDLQVNKNGCTFVVDMSDNLGYVINGRTPGNVEREMKFVGAMEHL